MIEIKKYYSIDRFENNWAVVEKPDGTMIQIKCSLLPENAKEGSMMLLSENGTFFLDEGETTSRKKSLADLQRRIIFGEKNEK